MQGTKNIYIDALKFGVDKMQTGVSFDETKQHLITLGWTIDITFEQYLRYWFNTNYFNPDFEIKVVAGSSSELWSGIQNLKQYDPKKVVMSAKAYELLQDYEKLQETRKSSNQAKSIAITSIIMTGIFALLQCIISLFTI